MKQSKNNTFIIVPPGKTLLLAIAAVFSVMLQASACFCQVLSSKDIAGQAEQHVEKAIQIQQQSHRHQAKWEQEKSALVLEYENLIQEKKALETEQQILSQQQLRLTSGNQALVKQKKESIRVQKELIPFISTIHTRLESLVANDSPFLKKERELRLATLSRVIKDPEVTIAEKYRKAMEALLIEAEYGTTIEVYQDKILMDPEKGEPVLGNIFRLGRVSLFFLSLDQASCGVYNPDKRHWQILPDDMLPAICSAVQIGSKQRPVELLPLPIGRLARQGGDQ